MPLAQEGGHSDKRCRLRQPIRRRSSVALTKLLNGSRRSVAALRRLAAACGQVVASGASHRRCGPQSCWSRCVMSPTLAAEGPDPGASCRRRSPQRGRTRVRHVAGAHRRGVGPGGVKPRAPAAGPLASWWRYGPLGCWPSGVIGSALAARGGRRNWTRSRRSRVPSHAPRAPTRPGRSPRSSIGLSRSTVQVWGRSSTRASRCVPAHGARG